MTARQLDKLHRDTEKRIRKGSKKRVQLQVILTAKALESPVVGMAAYQVLEDAYGDFAAFFERAEAWYQVVGPWSDDHLVYSEATVLPAADNGLPPLMLFVTYCANCRHLDVMIGVEARV